MKSTKEKMFLFTTAVASLLFCDLHILDYLVVERIYLEGLSSRETLHYRSMKTTKANDVVIYQQLISLV